MNNQKITIDSEDFLNNISNDTTRHIVEELLNNEQEEYFMPDLLELNLKSYKASKYDYSSDNEKKEKLQKKKNAIKKIRKILDSLEMDDSVTRLDFTTSEKYGYS